eukprot:6560216-Prymnesium_polylepis.2
MRHTVVITTSSHPTGTWITRRDRHRAIKYTAPSECARPTADRRRRRRRVGCWVRYSWAVAVAS